MKSLKIEKRFDLEKSNSYLGGLQSFNLIVFTAAYLQFHYFRVTL